MTREAPTVTAVGPAVVRAGADDAVVHMSLSAIAERPGFALDVVARRADELTKILDDLDVPERDRVTSGIGVEEEYDYGGKQRRLLGHRATCTLSVRLTSAEVVGRLVSRAAADAEAAIHGPEWSISTENPVRLEAVRRAAAIARARAEACAQGVGGRLGSLVSLHERSGGIAIDDKMSLGARAVSASAEMPVEAGDREVSAVVEATFTVAFD